VDAVRLEFQFSDGRRFTYEWDDPRLVLRLIEWAEYHRFAADFPFRHELVVGLSGVTYPISEELFSAVMIPASDRSLHIERRKTLARLGGSEHVNIRVSAPAS